MRSPTSTRASISNRALIAMSLLLLAAHAPLILNNGIFFDDWLLLKMRQDSVMDLDFMWHGAGHPVFYLYDSIANLTGMPIVLMQVMALVAVLLGAVSLSLAATRARLLGPMEAIAFSLIVWTYPGYQAWAVKGLAGYVFSYGLFFVGTWLLMLAFDGGGARHVTLRIAAALAFFLSFALNSLMMLYVFAMFGLFVAVWRANSGEQGRIRRLALSAWRCAAGYPEFVVLPLVYWGALSIWFKRVGAYAGYYGIRLPAFADLLAGWNSFFQCGYSNSLARAARAAMDFKPLWTAVAVLVVITVVLARKSRRARLSPSGIGVPLLLSVLLFSALALPYLFAGIRPSLHFYETRHLLLFGLPGACFVLAVKRFAESIVGRRAALVGVFGLASLISVAALWNSYFFLQARVLKQEALSSHLAAMPMPAALVFDLNDGFYDHSPQHVSFGIPEVTGMLRLAWGDHPFLGFSHQAERPTILQEIESARNVEGSPFHSMDPSGPQATILLEPGPEAAPNGRLVRHYYACRLLLRCDVASFLFQLANVKIDVGPIAGVTPLARSK